MGGKDSPIGVTNPLIIIILLISKDLSIVIKIKLDKSAMLLTYLWLLSGVPPPLSSLLGLINIFPKLWPKCGHGHLAIQVLHWLVLGLWCSHKFYHWGTTNNNGHGAILRVLFIMSCAYNLRASETDYVWGNDAWWYYNTTPNFSVIHSVMMCSVATTVNHDHKQDNFKKLTVNIHTGNSCFQWLLDLTWTLKR